MVRVSTASQTPPPPPHSLPPFLTAGASTRLSSDTRRRVDEATRKRRHRQQLDALEKDNFHDDPHAAFAHLKQTKLPTFSDGTESVDRLECYNHAIINIAVNDYCYW